LSSLSNITKRSINYHSVALAIVLILHLVGLYQIIILDKKELINSSSIIILISFTLLIIPELKHWKSIVLPFITVYFIGWIAEVIGVNTSLLFGDYEYGESLGLKLFNTPLTIGILWLSLSIGAQSFLKQWLSKKWLIIILGASLLLCFDILLEPIAISFEMWTWAGDSVPIYNYVCWFVISLIMQIILYDNSSPKELFKYYFFINIGFFSSLYLVN
jgi:putative membrane protein